MNEKCVLLRCTVRLLYRDYEMTIVGCLVMLWISTVKVSNAPLILSCDLQMGVHTAV